MTRRLKTWKGFAIAMLGVAASVRAQPFSAPLPSAPAVQISVAPLNLAQIVQRAVGRAPEFKSLDASLVQARIREDNARAVLFPKLELTSSHGLADTHPRLAGASRWASAVDLAATQNFYDNGAAWTEVSLARRLREKAEFDLTVARDVFTAKLTGTFYDFCLVRATLALERERKKLLDRQYNLIQHQYRQGLKAQKDYLRLDADVRRSDLLLLELESSLRQALNALNSLVDGESREGAFDPVPLAPDVNSVRKLYSVEWTVPEVETLAAYRASALELETLDLQTRLSVREAWPRLSLQGEVGYGSQAYMGTPASFTDNDQLRWSLLVGLNWTIWDWGVRSRNVDAARASAVISSARIERTRADLRLDLKNSIERLSQKKLGLKLGEELRSLERSNLTQFERDYREGKLTYVELIDSLNSSLQAETQLVTDFFGFLRARDEFLQLKGKLYETLVDENAIDKKNL